jgi:predicted MFS family arabinose efflux permease
MGINAVGVMIAGVILPPLVVAVLPHIGWRGVFLVTAGILGFVVAPLAYFMLYDRPDPKDVLSHVEATKEEEASGPVMSFREILTRPNMWLITFVYIVVLGISTVSLNNLAPIVLSRGFDLATSSLLLSVVSASSIVAMLSFGAFVDRFGNRLPLVVLTLTSTAGIALLAVADSKLLLFAAIIPLGCASAIMTALPSTIAVEFGAAGFGRAFGLANATAIIPMAAPTTIARLKEASGSYFEWLMSLAVLGLIAAILAATLRQAKPAAQADRRLSSAD